MANTTENHIPAMNGNGPKDFSLRIANLPLEIEKDGAESLFREYGEVTGVMILKGSNKDTQQAFVSFSKYNEAEKAISDLHNKPPLYLNVQFKDKNLREQMTTDVDLSKPVLDFRHKSSSFRCTKLDMSRANCTPHLQPPNYTTEDELLYEVPTHPAIFNPYSNSGPYRETNLMFTRGLAYVSKDGRRHVAHGRGYTFYDLPEPHYDIGTYLQKELEKRENGYYEYATEDLEDEIANCKICQTPTAFRCQKCTTAFYCSRTCQLSDWPKHKQECQQLPPLIKKVNKTSLQNGHGVAQDQKEPDIVPTSQTTQQLRRPKPTLNETSNSYNQSSRSSTAAPIEHKSSVTPEKKGLRASPAASIKNSTISRHSEENKNDLFKLSTPANFKADTASFPSNQQQKQSTSAIRKTTVSSEENIEFQSQPFIPHDKFIKVVVAMPLNEGEYWVQRVEDEGKITDLLCNLRQYAKQTKTVPPEENVKCIVKTDDFYRAIIISITNNLAKVFYYDFGTWEEFEVKEVWPINGFENPPAFARKIRMTDESDPKLKTLDSGETLLVKATSLREDGLIIVQAQLVSSGNGEPARTPVEAVKTPVEKIEKQMTTCSLKTDSPKLSSVIENASENLTYEKLFNFPNILKVVSVGQTGLMMKGNKLGENEYSATIVTENRMEAYFRLFDELKEKSLKYQPTYKPKIGDLVSALASDEDWFRGVVISNSPVVRIALLEESRVIAPIKCVPLPDGFENIESMGLVVKFPKETKVPLIEAFNFTVTDRSNDSASATLLVKVENTTFEATVTVQRWNPKSEQKGLLVPQLLSGHQVCITEFMSQNSIHVQSVEPSEKERIFKLQQEIAKYSLTRKPLPTMPVVGQIVLAHYEADGNYYRAIVTKFEDKKALIKYIDYGNQEIVTVSKMYTLPDELKEYPSCVAEISLKNVDKNVPLTEAATIYMQELIAGEVPLICTFDGNPLENGVILKTSTTNEIVNDKLSVLLTPTWKQDKVEEDKTVYEITDLPSLKLGDVGDAIQAAFLCYYPDTGTIFFGPNDIDAVTAIQVQMAEQITEYVASTPDHYIPRNNELCIAKYLDAYYRAMCLESSATSKESRIFFVDYGNTELVSHKDIRIFTEDFLKIGAYATLCNISGIPIFDEDFLKTAALATSSNISPTEPPEKFISKISQRINEILVPNEIYEIKIISVANDGVLNVDIPALRVALMQEKLI